VDESDVADGSTKAKEQRPRHCVTGLIDGHLAHAGLAAFGKYVLAEPSPA